MFVTPTSLNWPLFISWAWILSDRNFIQISNIEDNFSCFLTINSWCYLRLYWPGEQFRPFLFFIYLLLVLSGSHVSINSLDRDDCFCELPVQCIINFSLPLSKYSHWNAGHVHAFEILWIILRYTLAVCITQCDNLIDVTASDHVDDSVFTTNSLINK